MTMKYTWLRPFFAIMHIKRCQEFQTNLEISSLELSLDKRRHHIAIMSSVGDKYVILILDFGWARWRIRVDNKDKSKE